MSNNKGFSLKSMSDNINAAAKDNLAVAQAFQIMSPERRREFLENVVVVAAKQFGDEYHKHNGNKLINIGAFGLTGGAGVGLGIAMAPATGGASLLPALASAGASAITFFRAIRHEKKARQADAKLLHVTGNRPTESLNDAVSSGDLSKFRLPISDIPLDLKRKVMADLINPQDNSVVAATIGTQIGEDFIASAKSTPGGPKEINGMQDGKVVMKTEEVEAHVREVFKSMSESQRMEVLNTMLNNRERPQYAGGNISDTMHWAAKSGDIDDHMSVNDFKRSSLDLILAAAPSADLTSAAKQQVVESAVPQATAKVTSLAGISNEVKRAAQSKEFMNYAFGQMSTEERADLLVSAKSALRKEIDGKINVHSGRLDRAIVANGGAMVTALAGVMATPLTGGTSFAGAIAATGVSVTLLAKMAYHKIIKESLRGKNLKLSSMNTDWKMGDAIKTGDLTKLPGYFTIPESVREQAAAQFINQPNEAKAEPTQAAKVDKSSMVRQVMGNLFPGAGKRNEPAEVKGNDLRMG